MESMTNYLFYCVNNLTEFCFIIEVLEGYSHFVNHSNFPKESNVTKKENKGKKVYGESTNYQFLDEINNTISLSTLSNKNKNLIEVEKTKKENKNNMHI